MIICLIFIGLLICSLIFLSFSLRHNSDALMMSCVGGLLIAVAASTVCVCMIISNNINYEGHLNQLKEERAAIVYQMDHELFLGDALGKFNGELVYNQMLNKSLWTNWFVGDYVMKVEPIKVE